MTPQILFRQALSLHQKGDLSGAEQLYREIMAAAPENFPARYMFALLCHQQGRGAEALAAVEAALKLAPNATEALALHGVLLQQAGRPEEALASFNAAVASNPRDATVWFNSGVILADQGHQADALTRLDRALAINPDYGLAWCRRGVVLASLKRAEEALAAFDKAVTIAPDDPGAWHGRGAILLELGRGQDALASFDRVLAARPDSAEAWHNRGVALAGLKRPDEALAAFDKVLALKPGAQAWNSRGALLQGLGHPDAALDAYDKALAADPGHADAWKGRGVTLQGMGRLTEALDAYDRALAIEPDSAEIWNNRGTVLIDLKRFDEALAAIGNAVTINPINAQAWSNRGNTFKAMGRPDEALACYDKALSINPDLATTLNNRSAIRWLEKKHYAPAIVDLEQVLRIDPDYEYARGLLLHLRMHAADWRNFEKDVALVDAGVRAGKRVTQPFVYQAISQSPADLQACSTIYAEHLYPAAPALAARNSRHRKIRLGYMSGELRAHAIGYLMAGLFEEHDKDHFELVHLDNGKADGSTTRRRVEAAFDKIVDITMLPDAAAAERIAAEEIDILVNLNGYFGGVRMGVFARRPAPIQVNYLGLPATLGAPYIDYILADRTVIPPDERRFYTEKVVWLPDTYWVNDSKRPIAATRPSRRACDLPEEAFVFCNFNQSYKLTPWMFATWIRVMAQVPGSVLWLLEGIDDFAENLRREAQTCGIAGERLIFAPHIPSEVHLARLALADLSLDSLPYNAHTTASDVLWAGVPLVTCRGTTFPGRVASSLLQAIGLADLICENLPDYEALAVKLATDPALLQSIRRRLAANRRSTPLFDTGRFRRNIETAYATMWDILQQGQSPRAFSVDT